MRLVVRPSGPLRGTVRVPGDKSIAHRWLILAATADGPSVIGGLPRSDDVRSTATCLLRLASPQPGLEAWLQGAEGPARIEGRGWEGLRQAEWPLDCGNSGTTMRLLCGALAGRPFESVLVGDESLSRRPMERVAEPLRLMGAEVETTDGHAPVTIRGGDLRGIEYRLPVPSAQVKGAVLLAGLQAEGETVVDESAFLSAQRDAGQDATRSPSRDHTERALTHLGAGSEPRPGGPVIVHPRRHEGFRDRVPGDLSSAAFLTIAAGTVPGSDLLIWAVGQNPSRTRFLEHLSHVEVSVGDDRSLSWYGPEGGTLGEPIGSLRCAGTTGTSIEVRDWELPLLIDEVPALAALACHLPGESRFEGAGELRVKESDRLEGLLLGIRALGGEAEVQGDDLVVAGGGLAGGEADSQGDHRIAMALAVAALGAENECVIHGAEVAAVSFPGFATTLKSLGADLEVVER